MQTRRIPNEMQQKFIDDFTNHSILYAGAGTGKTFSVAKKIEKAILQYGMKKEDILCLTFTSKGKQEMEEDISGLIDGGIEQVFTIHGFCLKLIKEEAKRTSSNYADPRVIDNNDFDELLRDDLIPDFSEKISNRLLLERTGKDLSFYRKQHPVLISPTLVWHVDGEYITYFGKKWDENRVKYYSNRQKCPRCDRYMTLENGSCSFCSHNYDDYIPDQFQYKYYDFFTAVRHLRWKFDLYSDNRKDDFIKAILRLKENEKKYRSVFEQKKTFNESYARAMEEFGGELLDDYLSFLEQENLIDYDSMIFNALRLLKTNPEIREKYRYQMIIVDEMQDTSEVEFEVLECLFHDALIVFCGDCFQTIYEWRGSEPSKLIKKLKESYGAVEYYFYENYRSSKNLCLAGFSFLKNAFSNDLMLPQEIKINSKKEGDLISVHSFESEALQSDWIYHKIKEYSGQSICLMTRNNFSTKKMAEHMQAINDKLRPEDQILFYTSQEENQFFSDSGIKDAIAFLRLFMKPSDLLSMERIALRYMKGVGRKTLASLRESKNINLITFLSSDTFEYGDEFASWLDQKQTYVVYDLETTGLDRRKDELLQIAAIKFDYFGNEIARMNELVVPSVPISEGALKTHNKSLEELKVEGTKDVVAVLKRFRQFAEGSYLFGHNSAAFDRVILRRQFKENGLEFPKITGEGDTLLSAKRILPNLKNYKLETLCSMFSIVNENAHDAFSDVCATKAVFLALRNLYVIPKTQERREETRQLKGKFESFFRFYQGVKKTIDEEDMPKLLSDLESVLMSVRTNKEDFVFRSRWNVLKTRLEKEEGFLEASLQHFVEEALRSGNQFSMYFNTEKRIPIVTVHQTKGCEYDVVFLFDMSEETFPSFNAMRAGKEEEERRLFYVAITRAKEKLCLTYCNRSNDSYIRHSKYVDFIQRDYVTFD